MKKTRIFSITYIEPFLYGLASSSMALLISGLYFPRTTLLFVATGLTCVGLIFEMNRLLTENRDAIWLHQQSGWEANTTLTLKMICIFAGIFLVTMLFQTFVPHWFQSTASFSPEEFFNNKPLSLFRHNLRVLVGCFILSFIYRSAGVLLVTSWNAMNWSTTIFGYIQMAVQQNASHSSLFYAAAIIPHLIFEAAAYVTSGMSGVFLSKGIFKYKLSSQKFFRVSRACLVILVASVFFLWIAVELEIRVAQNVLEIRGHN